MKVHQWENAFLTVGATVLLLCALALAYATLVHGLQLPGATGRVDPAQLATTPPFDRPGVYQRGPNAYEVVAIGRAWSFQPAEIRVPAGAEITFTATTTDVIHGFNIEGTRLNMMLIPGQISRNTYTFKEAGEYLLICHEYCGLAHHTMHGRIIVEAPGTQVPVIDAGAAQAPAGATQAPAGAAQAPSSGAPSSPQVLAVDTAAAGAGRGAPLSGSSPVHSTNH